MRFKVWKKDIRLTVGRTQWILYREWPITLKKVRYGNGTNEIQRGNVRRFRAAAQQAKVDATQESETPTN